MPAKDKTAKKASAKKASPKKMPTKTASAKKASPKKASAKGSAAKRVPTAMATIGGKPGDVILIDSERVGSPPREGEVLEVVHGQVSVSYLVRWTDGHQSLIAPGAGNTRIVSPKTHR